MPVIMVMIIVTFVQFSAQSVLRQVLGLLQSEFSKQFGLTRRLS